MVKLWRVGHKLGRTIYLQLGDEPSDQDVFLGIMENKELARQVVETVNEARVSGFSNSQHGFLEK